MIVIKSNSCSKNSKYSIELLLTHFYNILRLTVIILFIFVKDKTENGHLSEIPNSRVKNESLYLSK